MRSGATVLNEPRQKSGTRPRVLVADDDDALREGLARMLENAGYEVLCAADGSEAVKLLEGFTFDAILTDITMPGINGVEILHEVRKHDLHAQVVLITGSPSAESAIEAINSGAFRYLTKPIKNDQLKDAVARAVKLSRMGRVEREAADLQSSIMPRATDRAGLEVTFDSALASLWIAYQPIVRSGTGSVFGFEALLRSRESGLPHPGAVLEAAERLNRVQELGRLIRKRAAEPFAEKADDTVLFVNLHASDLLDEDLSSVGNALGAIASRVVLEITERAALGEIKDARFITTALRELGYRIAIDDLGAGYSGLTSLALLEPDIVKLDMSLVRGIDSNVTKRKLVKSMAEVSRDLGMMVVAEGVETVAERDVLVDLGCDLLQGYWFAKPGPAFPEARY
jgi:EAL domain-containing protein (putative c-di-GMP-specific phosphodiesterase class I)